MHKIILFVIFLSVVVGCSVFTQGASNPKKAIGVAPVIAADYIGGNHYALIIGINDYADPRITDLTTCQNDALAMVRVLTNPETGGVQRKDGHLKLLLGKQVTVKNIKKGFSALSKIPVDSTVFIYFSGHGAKDGNEAYWITHDTELADLFATGFSDTDVRKFINKIPAKRVIVMLDCCYATATVKGRKSNTTDFSEVLTKFTGKGRAYLMAAGSGEESIEAKDLKRSVFTHYLVEGLEGKADDNQDGVVVLPELTNYIDKHVADEARMRGGLQRPTTIQDVQEPSKFRLTINADRLRETAVTKALKLKRLTVLRKFYLDDEVLTLPQYQEGQLLINDNTETLDEIALLKRAEYIKVADGELLPSKLQRILDAFETPAQRKSRVRLAKIAKLLSTAQANDNKTDGKQALVYLDELLTLDPYHGEAKALRQKIMRYYPQVGDTRTNSLGMKFVYIPAGSFEMGSPSYEAGREDDEQRHSVTLTEGFWLGQHEVTVASFQSFVRATRYLTTADIKGNAYGFTKEGNKLVDGLTWQSPGIDQNDHHPVVQVSWNDAMAYCQWLTKKEGNLYTLPTEAQWEYACRGGTTTMYSFGGSVEQGEGYLNIADEDFETWVGIFGHTAKNRVRWHDGYGTTAPIGSFRANGFGLYDMHGNVWEWCSDWFGKEYYSTGPAQDPTGPTSGQYRVLRGGSWRIRPGLCRSAIRNWRSPGIRNINIGFRILSLDF